MTWKTRPDTSKRDALLKELLNRGMSADMMLKITEPLEDKTQEEKEQIAAEILEKLCRQN